MSQDETTRNIPFIPKFISQLILILVDSIKLIFIHHPKLFLLIYVTSALPLSLSTASLSLSAVVRHLKLHIRRLDFLHRAVDIWVEAANVVETLELDLKDLHRFKLLRSLPVFAFSLLTLTAVAAVVTAGKRKPTKPTLRAAAAPAATAVVAAVFWVVWGYAVAAVGRRPTAATAVILAVEVYAMAVFAVAGVVSTTEGRVGFEAIRAGSGLMKGSRAVGWVLSGLILLTTNLVGREIVGVMDGGDLMGGGRWRWTVEMRGGGGGGYLVGLMMLLGWVIMWSYVVITVYYCECRKRCGVIRQDDVELVDVEF